MTAIEDERIATDDDVAELLADIEEAAAVGKAHALLPAIIETYEYDPAGWLELTYLRHQERADNGDGFWGERPAGLRALREHNRERVAGHVWVPVEKAEWIYGWFALASNASIFGALRLLRLPVTRAKWEGGPPTLTQLRAEIGERGPAGRAYGRFLLGTHAAGYLAAGQLQWPGRTILTVLIAVLFLLVIKFDL